MGFNKKHYREVKKLMLWRLNNVPWCCSIKNPIEWAETFMPLIINCIDQEDYEGAQGTKDAIIEFLNQFIPIPEDVLLKLEKFK